MSNLRDYKPSGVDWIGHIPTSWRLLRGRFLFESKKEINRDLQCQNLLSLTLFGVLNKDYEATDGLRPENYNSYQIFQKDDLVFKMIDLENVRTSRVGIVHEEGIMSPVYIRHEPVKNKIIPRFAYWFYYDLYKKEIYNSIGSGVRSSLTSSDLLELELPVPPLEEQKLISCFLDHQTTKIDSLINKIEKKVELLKEQRTSLINQCVTKGLDPNVEMKDSGVEWIGQIPRHWKKGRFKHYIDTLTDFTSNGSFKALADNVEYLSEGFSRLVRLTDLREDLTNEGIFVSEEAHNFLKKSELFGGEILIANVGAYTGLALKMSKGKGVCTLGPNMFLVKNNSDVSDVDYAVYLLNADSTKKEFDLVISSTAQPKINKDNLRGLVVPIPPVKEQEEISRFINQKTKKLDLILKAEEKRILVLKEYRQTLISTVVTGKLSVTEDMLCEV